MGFGVCLLCKIMKIYLALVGFLFLQASCTIFPNKYSAKEIEAWVIDEETGAPLEGVIVVAAWELKGGLELGNPVGNANLMETVTDKNGRFYFPAWGPVWKKGALLFNDPNLYFFKSGYEYERLSNKIVFSDLETGRGSVRSSDWHSKTIKLKRFQGSLQEYAEQLSFLNTSIESVVGTFRKNAGCEWIKMPKMLAEIFRLESFLAKKDMYNPLMRIDRLPINEQCNSPRTFFKEYLTP